MAANFYLSSHANYHLHPRSALLAARVDDLRHATEQEIAWVEIWSGSGESLCFDLGCTFIQKLCKRLGLRQQVIATAIVYFRRFYLRNAYCDTDCALVAAACCYVAAKAEETPVHVKSAVAEAKMVFHDMGLAFPSDNTKLAEMEFYLVEELDFHLIVFHPYRSLVQLCGRDGGPSAGGEQGRLNRQAMLEMDEPALQMAWFIINDTFRSSLCLVHPPHLIALAAIYLAFSLHPPPSVVKETATANSKDPSISGPASRTRRRSTDVTPPTAPGTQATTSSTVATTVPTVGGRTDAITFLASLQVDHSLILEIVQDVISLYELWNQLEASAQATSPSSTASQGGPSAAPVSRTGIGGGAGRTTSVSADEKVVIILARMMKDRHREVQSERGGRGATGWKK
ncbi:BZ3500_MvSof-1268-A1-R1_Chr7-1g09226 [Microbotryum saponariae]|uniref:BZ3500_MvSof-1268-A1-R1_Chr7-1g09226 protein n=1 Tax=Microbotryum saponariae TaxID=289078 RepID=A0A2X0LUS9_9BASI|nr:BZ3501_MvSof-1269-A2-R1_Chr7-1g08931 [Microbotryum saponariae]SDA03033.1 BZ3500_MvSof-1268-A1-R1_Chr7-1g09226 [Microbotryum saponariae]